MSGLAEISKLLRGAIAAAIVGLLVCLALLVRETPYTLAAFMFLGQPLLAVAFLLFTIKVFRDLRAKKLL
jgi:hypothetical protein